ncbi:50S ribosomal protein L25/general stress protein Ctc [Caenispirillum salinarum]|uniref:50S ribosomal protein L25/general stress protein Ctc n=1 Tax=Caenispirillum salinarum TaxID=859058 RepID=UPI00384B9433
MANENTLNVSRRDRAGKGAARATRRAGLVPGVVYGNKQPTELVAMDPRPLIAEMHKSGFNTRVFTLNVEGGNPETVMVHDVQFNPVTDDPQAIDFLRVSADKEVVVSVPTSFINEEKSPGIKRGGVLNVVRHEIEVKAKASDLPEVIECDLTGLDVNDSLHISAVKLPAGVAPTITDRDFTIATIAAPSGLKSAAAAEGEEEGEGEE